MAVTMVSCIVEPNQYRRSDSVPPGGMDTRSQQWQHWKIPIRGLKGVILITFLIISRKLCEGTTSITGVVGTQRGSILTRLIVGRFEVFHM